MEDCLKDLEYFSKIHNCLVIGEIVGIEEEDSYKMKNNDDGEEEICESKYIRKITNVSSNPLGDGICEYIKGKNQFLEADIKEQKGLFYLLEVENEEGTNQTILSRQKQLRYIEYTPIEDYIQENYANVIIKIPPELSSWVKTDRFQEVLQHIDGGDEVSSETTSKFFFTSFPQEAPTSIRILCDIDNKELVRLIMSTAIENEKKLTTICQDKENSKKQLEEAQKKNKTFYVSSKFVGLIIGSQGANIKNLKTKYNVSINVDSKKTNEKGETKVIISGDNGDNVEACYKEVNFSQKIYELPEGVEYELKKKGMKFIEDYKIKSFKISSEEIVEEDQKYKAPNVTIIGPAENIEQLYENEIKNLEPYSSSNSGNYNYENRSSYRGNKGRGYNNNYGYNNDGYKRGGYYNRYSYGNSYYKK